jgi:hypothetical protein
MVDLPQVVDYGHEKFFTTTLNQLDVLSLLPLYISLIYGVFFNKAFQDCSLKILHMEQ